MNAVAQIEPKRSVLADMAAKYGMEIAAFEATVRATCIKPDKDGRVASREEFAAFLLVARQYDLNPLTKQIYAYTDRGRVIPIVGVDGWSFLINTHPMFDGMSFHDELNERGDLVSVTCKMFRKDRGHPIEITEYMVECKRDADTWKKWPRRMLRHKAMIQGARYAFSLTGIYDPDEAARIVEARANDARRLPPPPPPAPETFTPAGKKAPPGPPPVVTSGRTAPPPPVEHDHAEDAPFDDVEPAGQTSSRSPRMSAEYVADLIAEGDRCAALGMDELQEFLDGLEGDDQPLVNAHVVGWQKSARNADAKAKG